MKKLSLYLSLFLMIILANCGPNESESEYEQLLQKSDTLEKRNTNLSAALDTIQQAHDQLSQNINSMTEIDTAWLEQLARHEVVIKNQKATFDKNKEVFSGHNEFRNKRDQATQEEFKAQISEMKQGHNEIGNELDQVENQQKTINEEHKSIRKKIKERQQEDNQSN